MAKNKKTNILPIIGVLAGIVLVAAGSVVFVKWKAGNSEFAYSGAAAASTITNQFNNPISCLSTYYLENERNSINLEPGAGKYVTLEYIKDESCSQEHISREITKVTTPAGFSYSDLSSRGWGFTLKAAQTVAIGEYDVKVEGIMYVCNEYRGVCSSYPVNMVLKVRLDTSFVTIGAVVSSAGFTINLAPGQLATIFGIDLTTDPACVFMASTVPAPTSACNNTRLFAKKNATDSGTALPLLYVSKDQINFQVPLDMPLVRGFEVVRGDGKKYYAGDYNPFFFEKAFYPDLFKKPFHIAGTTGSRNYAHLAVGQALNDGKYENYVEYCHTNTAVPCAKPGQYLILYLTGLGKPDYTGQNQPFTLNRGAGDWRINNDRLALKVMKVNTVVPPTLANNGIDVSSKFKITYAGYVGGSLGLNQLNIQLDPTLETGIYYLTVTPSAFSFNTGPAYIFIRK
ncbi:MAG TPA: hypothetical protein VEA59_04440 [Patescibacteria group bacterium]|nr:hypothetical protein [Patescibacteria group bacterium]